MNGTRTCTLRKRYKNVFKNVFKLFGAFIDFKQAFETVWRNRLWYKLMNNGISGKCLTFIRNMYNGVKSMVSINGESSDFFNYNIGVFIHSLIFIAH